MSFATRRGHTDDHLPNVVSSLQQPECQLNIICEGEVDKWQRVRHTTADADGKDAEQLLHPPRAVGHVFVDGYRLITCPGRCGSHRMTLKTPDLTFANLIERASLG
eukprot:5769143-Prymnesium_polylepis.1